MQVNVTFRQTDSSDALKTYAEKKMKRLKKYLNSSFEANIVLSVDKKNRHKASINVASNSGINIQGDEMSNDMYASIDLAVAKLERQVKKHRQKLRGYKHKKSSQVAKMNIYASESFYDHDEVEVVQDEPVVIKSTDVTFEYLTVKEAVMKFDFKQQEVLPFTNKENNRTSIVYLKKDGNYGLMEF